MEYNAIRFAATEAAVCPVIALLTMPRGFSACLRRLGHTGRRGLPAPVSSSLWKSITSRSRDLSILLLFGVLATNAAANDFSKQRLANWHQWRGPEATGAAPYGDPPIHWSEQTNIKWKVPIPGLGTSTPVIWGERLFLLTAMRADRQAEAADAAPSASQAKPGFYHRFVVLCLDRRTGRMLWQQTACEVVPHEGHHPNSSYAAASPVTDGRHVYCSFGSRGIYCYDMHGKQQWKADLGQLKIKFSFGEGSSPALYRDTLIVNCDHEGASFITALDAGTGAPRWKVGRDENSTWNTPLVAEYKDRVQVIVNGAKSARSYDLATGALLWKYGGPAGVDAIPSPLRLGGLAIFLSGFKGDPAYAIGLDSSGDLGNDDIAWKHTGGTPQVSSAALVGERLYFTKGLLGIVSCLNARTGKVIIDQKRLPALTDIYASPVAAAGRVYFTGRGGETVIIDGTVDHVRVLAQNRLDETVVASPAIVGGEMYIRGDRSLYCISAK